MSGRLEIVLTHTSVQTFEQRFGVADLAVELEVRREMPVRGGLLGDTVGYGKTACMIALIRETLGCRMALGSSGGSSGALSPAEEELAGRRVLIRDRNESKSGFGRFDVFLARYGKIENS